MGTTFANTQRNHCRRLDVALTKTASRNFGELQHRLLRDEFCFAQVLSCLTVKVTEMFRDPDFYKAFRSRVVPLLRTYPRVRLWHAGCASGEEVYSMGVLLYEEGLHERVLLYGTDLDGSAIERAKEGVYSTEQLSSFEKNYQLAGGLGSPSHYVTRAYGKVSISANLRENVSFFQHDLGSDFTLGEMNVILCRNVCLYFSDTLRARVFALFTESLCRGGFLCLGASESLTKEARLRFKEYVPTQRIFRLENAHA